MFRRPCGLRNDNDDSSGFVNFTYVNNEKDFDDFDNDEEEDDDDDDFDDDSTVLQ